MKTEPSSPDACRARKPPVALVTGAAGGLGSQIVSELLAQGWRVAAGFHHRPLERKSDALFPVRLDVTKEEDAAAAVADVLARWERLDLLVNNAGLIADATLSQMSEAQWDEVMAVNLNGAFICARAALKPMLRQRSGHIINISSFSARRGPRGQVNYAAAKAGLIGLTQSLAREVGARNIRVNAVLPGLLRTSLTSGLTPAQWETLARANVLGRINDMAEVARFIVFLAGMENVSGQIFQLDSRISRWT